MAHVALETLFLDPANILFVAETEVPDEQHHWSEFEFRATDLHALAWLTYDHEEGEWAGRIQTAQNDDGHDDDPEPADPDQVAVLLTVLPDAALAKVQEYREAYRERSSGFVPAGR